jgi:hypothetical protein
VDVGNPIIGGEVSVQNEAENVCCAAQKAGHVAALAPQARPNVCSHPVANIASGGRVSARLHSVQPRPTRRVNTPWCCLWSLQVVRPDEPALTGDQHTPGGR